MNTPNVTPIPDSIFDMMFPRMNEGEVKTLLTIYRYTWGVVENSVTNKRKDRAWLPNDFFQDVTGLSARTINRAIDSLARKKLIRVTSRHGTTLDAPRKRMGNRRLYFEPIPPERWNKCDPYIACSMWDNYSPFERFTLQDLLD